MVRKNKIITIHLHKLELKDMYETDGSKKLFATSDKELEKVLDDLCHTYNYYGIQFLYADKNKLKVWVQMYHEGSKTKN